MSKYLAIGLLIAFIAFFIHNVDSSTRNFFPSPGYDPSSIPDQSGKVIIITGGSTGIGRASAEQLCKKGAKLIIITSRSQDAANKVASEIQQQYCNNNDNSKGISKVIGRALELEDHKSIKKFAEWFKSLNEPLHVLMLNAGLARLEKSTTSLGLEKNIGSNWFGHFYLQQLLQDIVEQSAPSRIVILSSSAANVAPPIIHSIDKYVKGEEAKGANQYIVSKLFNVYHAKELHRRLREKGINNVYVNSLNPGLIATNLFDSIRGEQKFPFNYIQSVKNIVEKGLEGGIIVAFLSFLAETIGLSPLEGALTQLYAATSPDIEKLNISGEFFYPIARREDKSWYYFGVLSNLSPQARDPELAKKVWTYGESLIASIPKDQ